MATHTPPRSTRLEPAIESLLTRLRRRIRAYIWADGIAAALVVVGACFWASLALDWLVEPPRALRIALLLGAVGGLAFVVYRLLVARLLVRLGDRNMALVLERRFGQFRDALLTAVELSEAPDRAVEFNSEMLAHTRREATSRSTQIDLGEIFNTAPLARRVSLAATLIVAALVFAVAAPQALGVWARRNLLMSDELWPRKTHLDVAGLDRQGHAKIARGADWHLVVQADAAIGRDVPDVVEIRYSTADGARGRENMSREGVATPGDGALQDYSHTFKSVLAPLEFYVRGGDDRRGPFYLDVVDSPTITMTLDLTYPAYMRREPRTLNNVTGLVQVPRGTEIAIRADANKPLVSVRIDDVTDENSPVAQQLDLAAEGGAPQTNFEHSLPALDGDKTLLFMLYDSDGIRSREPVRLSIGAIADEPPQVSVLLKGIGTAITSMAQLPAAGEVADDYGVARVWFEYRVDEKPAVQRPFAATVDGQEKINVADTLDVAPFALQPKQKVNVSVQAADACALVGGPNIGSSQHWTLDVVTPEQLRTMLEARELSLRRRFETIIEELSDTRNLLATIELKSTPPADKSKESPPADSKLPAAEALPADDEGTRAGSIPQSVQAERVVQNVERSRHETLQVALAIDDIREELINNRVDTEELRTRLKDGVSDPLKRIAGEMFPPLGDHLKRFTEVLANPTDAAGAQKAAVAQTDAILVEMKQVLDKMLELETYNEVVDMLRQVISAQEKVNAETKQKQKQKLRDLTE